MNKKQYTEEEITKGLGKLAYRLSRIAIVAQILDGYLNRIWIISDKTRGMTIMLGEVAFHVCGQLSRLCFDESRKRYKIASLLEIHRQIESFSNNHVKGQEHRMEFESAGKEIINIQNKYKAIQDYCDKYYAHQEIEPSEDELKKDYSILQSSWQDVSNLINEAKKILNIITLYWKNSESDFSENEYETIKNGFWKLIDLPQEPIDLKLPTDERWYK